MSTSVVVVHKVQPHSRMPAYRGTSIAAISTYIVSSVSRPGPLCFRLPAAKTVAGRGLCTAITTLRCPPSLRFAQ